jgi:hypothetical protein
MLCHQAGVTHFLYPGFGAQRQIYCHGVRAIHEPDTGDQLEEPDEATTWSPGQ